MELDLTARRNLELTETTRAAGRRRGSSSVGAGQDQDRHGLAHAPHAGSSSPCSTPADHHARRLDGVKALVEHTDGSGRS